ncbi:MAG: DUF4260 domain-containing protein [Chloroflexota bacterium]|nr:DUF4260 domain-containing protein [Chloroflexota bacterium]
MVRMLLKAEGAMVCLGSLLLYFQQDGGWVLLVLLLLGPDLSMLGYLAGPRAGSRAYDAVHTYVSPGLLLGAGLHVGTPLAVRIALIWTAHIGLDRLLGYGLKYPSHFKDTHLQRV